MNTCLQGRRWDRWALDNRVRVVWVDGLPFWVNWWEGLSANFKLGLADGTL